MPMKVYRDPEILWREEDVSRAEAYAGLSKGEDAGAIGTSILFSDGIMLSLNVLGTEIWKRCDGRSVDEIVSDLTKEFDVEPAVLKTDALAFLAELEQKGFIRYEDR
jgi:pyrroloquinoline quinone biosynthesis protein D